MDNFSTSIFRHQGGICPSIWFWRDIFRHYGAMCSLAWGRPRGSMAAVDVTGLVVLGLAVVLGSSMQRLTGMGFALVAAPFLVLLLGPDAGVTLIQVLGMITSLLVLASVWRDVEWRTVPWLLGPALVGIVPGAWLARTLPAAVLQILVGALIIVALLVTVASTRARVFTGRGGAAAAGFLSGFMNATASVGGPALVLYQLSRGWTQRVFVATLQVYFVALSIATVVARGVPQLGRTQWLISVVALGVGLMLGNRLARRVPERGARLAVLAIAFAGAAATIVKGLVAL